MNPLKTLTTRRGDLELPLFLPDATRGVLRTIDATDLTGSGTRCLMVSVIHLTSHPGVSVIKAHGGIHTFMGWPGPIFSDSGGFQVYSLISGGAKMGGVTRRGFVYRLTKGGEKKTLTPEKSIQKQLQMGTDVLFCLDYCTSPGADENVQAESVDITIEWARRCKEEFVRQVGERDRGKNPEKGKKPLLFAVIQGGESKELRKRCADGLFDIGFDGYGFGGWPIDEGGNLVEAVEWVADWVPRHYPLHGLGIGKPENILLAQRLGFNIFDCVLPSRDARHGRLYIYNPPFPDPTLGTRPVSGDFYRYLYIKDAKHVRDNRPPDESCDCHCCRTYSRAYLHHLLKIDDPLLSRLATIHNLRFYSRLMGALR